jgi:hypothetical protein
MPTTSQESLALAQAADSLRKTYDAAGKMALACSKDSFSDTVRSIVILLRLSCLLKRVGNIISEAALLTFQALATLKPHKALYLHICANSLAGILQHLLNLLCIIFHISLL